MRSEGSQDRSNKTRPASRGSVQVALAEELKNLKRRLKIEDDLEVVWSPDDNSHLSGELKGRKIYIYEPDQEKARKTLRHEFIDHLVSQALEPYRNVTNTLIKMVNDEAYKRKERIVEIFTRLFEEMSPRE